MTLKRVLYCVLAVFLAAILCTGGAAAETDVRTVQSGDDVFVYENISLNDVSQLRLFSTENSPVNTITAGENYFSLTKEAVGNNYGTYYAASTWDEAVAGAPNVSIWYPEISLLAERTTGENGATQGDSIDGKSIQKNTNVTFIINAPKVGPANIGATAKIVFTTPAGGKTITFGNENFINIGISAAQTVANGKGVEAGDEAAAGTWTAQAEYTSPICFANKAVKSNSISFTVEEEHLSITASADSVVRGNPFTVTVSGKADCEYAVFIEGYTTVQGTVPTLVTGQEGCIGNEVKTSDGSVVGATFRTDNTGKRTIRFDTTSDTKVDTYNIRVERSSDASDYDSVKVKVTKGTVTVSTSGDGTYYLGEEIKLSGTNTDSDTIYLFITGVNIAADGISLRHLPIRLDAGKNNQPLTVENDHTWEYTWNTTDCGFDPGSTYTIYATSRLTNGKASSPEGDAVRLSDAEYATVFIHFNGEEKKISISAWGSWPYYLGDSITFSGHNTETREVFLFITGGSLAENGVVLNDLPTQVEAEQNSYPVTVDSSGRWTYTWNTPATGLDAGGYTVYATSKLTNGKSNEADGTAVALENAEYADVSVSLTERGDGEKLTAEASPKVVAKGDNLSLKGSAVGTDNLMIYIFGANFFEPHSVNVNEDDSYELVITTENWWASNSYYVVVEHPTSDNTYDAQLKAYDMEGNVVENAVWSTNTEYNWIIDSESLTDPSSGSSQGGFIVWGQGKLQGSNAADALTKMLDGAGGDDIYTKLSFTVVSPVIMITDPDDQTVGSKVTISGTTNLAAGDQLAVTVQAEYLTEPEVSETVIVTAGEEMQNTWSVTIDTTNWAPDKYVIWVTGVGIDATASTTLNLVSSGSENITITATPKSTALGNTITLSGKNRVSEEVYLFLVGSDIPETGVVLQSLPDHIDAAKAEKPITVGTDNTWKYLWDTANSGLSSGTYRIYATSKLTNGKSNEANGNAVALKDAECAVAAITLNEPGSEEETDITYEPAFILPSAGDLYVGERVSATFKIFIPKNSEINRIDLYSNLIGTAYTGILTQSDGQPITEFPAGRNYLDGYALSGLPWDTILTITMDGYVPESSAGSEISVIEFAVISRTEATLLAYASEPQNVLESGTRKITAAAFPSEVMPNVTTTISGIVEGNPDTVMLYVFGRNKYLIESVSVKDGTYNKAILIDKSWASDQYFVLVEHPGENTKIDVSYDEEEGILSAGDASFIIKGDPRLAGSHAFHALGKMIGDTGIDDTYAITEFRVTGNDPTPEPDIPSSHGDTITITASATTIPLGESVTFRGLNRDGKEVYLFMTGPNLLANGVLLPDATRPGQIAAGTASAPTAVTTSNTWSYLWDTTNCWLDTGIYTIYATDRLTNGTSSVAGSSAAALGDANYASITVALENPFLSILPSAKIVAKGDTIRFSGTATGDPKELKLYIFGPNKFLSSSVTVNDDSYEKKLDIGPDWASNQYYIVAHHPMMNKRFDVQIAYLDWNTNRWQSTKSETSQQTILYLPNPMYVGQEIPADKVHEAVTTASASVIVEGVGKLQSSNAADALTKMLDSANIDDVYAKQTFSVAKPWIRIKNPGPQTVGSAVTITGTTNLAAGKQILVEVLPMSLDLNKFDKTQPLPSSDGKLTYVIPGGTQDNAWSVTIDTNGWDPDKYKITALGIDVDVTDMKEFLLNPITPTNLKIIEGPLSVTAGDTKTYKASATNAKYYKWYLDNTEITGQTGASAQITFPEYGTKVVKVTASYDGKTYVGPATRAVQVAEKAGDLGTIGDLTTHPTKPVVKEVTTFTIEPVTNAVRYTWKFTDGKTYTTTAPATQHVLPGTTEQTLTLTAYNSAGANKSKTFTIGNIGEKPQISLSPATTTANVGDQSTFTANGAEGTFIWYLDGSKQTDTGNTFTTKSWDYNDAGTHTVSVTVNNDYGTATAFGTVTVDAGDTGRLIKKITGDDTLKKGASGKYQVLVVHSNEAHDIQWELDGKMVGTNSKFYEFSADKEEGETYILKVTVTKNGRTDSEEITIVVVDGKEKKSKEPVPKSPPQNEHAISPRLTINDSESNPLEYISGIQLNTSDLNEEGEQVYVNLTILNTSEISTIPPFTDDMGSKKDTLLAINIEPSGLKNEKNLDNYALLTIRLPEAEVGDDPSLVSFYRYDTGADNHEWEYLTLQGTPTKQDGFYQFTIQTGGMSTFVAAYGQARTATAIPDVPSIPSSSSSSDGNMNNAFRILYNTNGGNLIPPTTDLSYGDHVARPADPVRNGYTFGGWYTDTACTNAWSFSNPIPGDMTLYAKWIGEGSSEPVPTTKSTTDQTSTSHTAKATTTQPAATTSTSPAETTASQSTLTQVPAPLAGLLSGLGAAALLLRRRD